MTQSSTTVNPKIVTPTKSERAARILAADPEPSAPHPHDRTVSLRIDRRGGSVAPREMHCLCPVRPAPERAWRTRVGG